jgi:chromosome segregation ATPase
MKLATTIVLLSLLACTSALAEDFTTSKGLRSVPSLGGLTNANTLQQAQQAGVSTLADLMADAAALDHEGTALVGDADALRKKVADEKSALAPARSHFDAANKKYLADLAAYNGKSQALSVDISSQQSEAKALENVISAQRDQATVERLNKWAADLDARRKALDADRATLDSQQESVEAERQNIARMEAQATAKLKDQSDSYQSKFASRRTKLASVIGELRRCTAYVIRVRELLKTKFNVAAAPLPLLDAATARIREFDHRVP